MEHATIKTMPARGDALCRFGLPPLPRRSDAPMRIAFPSGMNGQIVVTMEKAGIAKKNGLNARFASFQYGPPMMEALAAGSIDAVVTSLMPVTSYAAKMPGDVKVVAMLGKSSHSLMVAKDSPGSPRLEALAGKKLGVSFGSDSHLEPWSGSKQTGSPTRLELINVAPAELATALANKSVDAIVIRQPQVLRLQQQSGARILHTWPFRFVSIVKTKFIASQPEVLKKYMAALREALLFIAQNKEQSAQVVRRVSARRSRDGADGVERRSELRRQEPDPTSTFPSSRPRGADRQMDRRRAHAKHKMIRSQGRSSGNAVPLSCASSARNQETQSRDTRNAQASRRGRNFPSLGVLRCACRDRQGGVGGDPQRHGVHAAGGISGEPRDALRQSEEGGELGGPPFRWDIALDLGDNAGLWDLPDDKQGAEVARQYGVLQEAQREDIYPVAGNHDASPGARHRAKASRPTGGSANGSIRWARIPG